MKKKIILFMSFAISLLPMLMNQYGGCRGVQEVSGVINLFNPIGMASIVLFVVGAGFLIKNENISKCLGALGVIGIVVSEIYTFFTWHIMTITGEISLKYSWDLAYPEFYIGVTASVVMVMIYFAIEYFGLLEK